MEVEGDFKRQAKALTSAGLNQTDLCAEQDGSVDVEWITRPLTAAEGPVFLRKAVKALAAGGAEADRKSCGCHHNVDRFALDDGGWGRACLAVDHFYDDLFKFSGRHRSANYARKHNVHPHTTAGQALAACKAGREKYSCVAFHKPDLVELRLPGMSVDPAVMVTQFKMYSNLIRNSANPGMNSRHFLSSFGPLDDEMEAVLKKLGIKYSKEPPAPLAPPAPPPPRKGFWDIRVGDLVEFMTPAAVYQYHGIPPELQNSLMDGSTNELYRQHIHETLTVCGVREDWYGGGVLEASRYLDLEYWQDNSRSTCVGHLRVVYSGDGSQLYGEATGLRAAPPAMRALKPHPWVAVPQAVPTAAPVATPGTEPVSLTRRQAIVAPTGIVTPTTRRR
jgi:hypothetical protein